MLALAEKDSLVERFATMCRSRGIKLTQQRLVVLQEVLQRRDHPDAETIFRAVRRKLPTISLDTIYRTLWFLHDLGLVEALGSGTGSMRFDTNINSHHHFICSRCGAIHDFADDEFDRLRVPAAAAVFGRIEKTQVEFRGLCRICEKSKRKKTKERANEKK
ncbi:MAG: transcriptional repressor [Candidatus Aminicenantes bacterium]|nr:transcriptional repressor [Candidatus Aminicenantes bacterium]